MFSHLSFCRNELERQFLELLQFNINVPSSVYAKYYFDLRSLAEANNLSFPLEPLSRDRAYKLEVRGFLFRLLRVEYIWGFGIFALFLPSPISSQIFPWDIIISSAPIFITVLFVLWLFMDVGTDSWPDLLHTRSCFRFLFQFQLSELALWKYFLHSLILCVHLVS